MRRIVPLAVIFCLMSSRWATGQQAAPPKSSPSAAPRVADPTEPIKQALAAYVDAFNKHDAAAVASHWTEQGVHVNKETGARTRGREALAKDFAALFAESPAIVLSGSADEIRLVGADAAMIDGVSTVVVPNEEPVQSAFSAILVKQGDKWLIDAVHESDLPVPESAQAVLQPLAWMVGSWQDETDGAAVTTRTRWAAGESFLVRSYNVAREGIEPFEGTQVIGWDPVAEQIRSWTFSSDGSFGEGFWSKNGGDWMVRTVQTLPDGRIASGTQVITRVDDDTASVQMIAKEIDGAPEPSADPVTMKRIADLDSTAANDATQVAP